MKAKAIRIKVEGYVTFVPDPKDYPDGSMEAMLAFNLEQADDDPYAIIEGLEDSIKFTGEIVEVDVDDEGNIVDDNEFASLKGTIEGF